MSPFIKACLATGRVSNLPTVWSTTVVAYFLSSACFCHSNESLWMIIALCLANALFYVGGCFMGDAIDADYDRKHRPNRPIPSGVLNVSKVMATGASMMGLAYILICLLYPDTSTRTAMTAMVACICTYAIWHKKKPQLALPLMSSCRALLVIFSATAGISQHPENLTSSIAITVIFFSLSMFVYTYVFASVARHEHKANVTSPVRLLASIVFVLPFAALISNYNCFISLHCSIAFTLIALVTYWLWQLVSFQLLKKSKIGYVSYSLAGFCLIDAIYASFHSPALVGLTFIFFACALGLQKISSAT